MARVAKGSCGGRDRRRSRVRRECRRIPHAPGRLCPGRRPRVVWASSTTVFGPADEYAPMRVDETAPRHPAAIYGLTKALAEEVGRFYRRRTCMEICAVRPPLVFGPGRWYGGAAQVRTRLLAAAARRETIALTVPAEHFDLMHGDDVAAAFLHLARHSRPLAPCYHVNGFATSYREIAGAADAGNAQASAHCSTCAEFDRLSADLGRTHRARRPASSPRFDLRARCADLAGVRDMIEARLAALGLTFPAAAEPSFHYLAVTVHQGVAYVSGQLPKRGRRDVRHVGKVGAEIPSQQAQEAARICILQGLACLGQTLGSLDRVEQVAEAHWLRRLRRRLHAAAEGDRCRVPPADGTYSANTAAMRVRRSASPSCRATLRWRSR